MQRWRVPLLSFSIVLWSHMLQLRKHLGEIIGVVIADAQSNFGDSFVSLIQQIFGFLYSELVDIVGEGHPQRFFEGAGEIGRMDAKRISETVQA